MPADPNAFVAGANHGRGNVGEPITIGAPPGVDVGRVPHPRGGASFRELSPQRQGEAMEAFGRFHAEERPRTTAALHTAINEIQSNPRGMTDASRRTVQSYTGALDEMASLPSDPMEAAVHRVTQTLEAPIHAARQHFKDTGQMVGAAAGEFYGQRNDIGWQMAQHYFDDPDAQLRAFLSTPPMSSRTDPQTEVGGASGGLALLRSGADIGVHVNQDLADLFNTPPKTRTGPPSLGYSGRHGGGADVMMQPGKYDFGEFSQMYPQAATVMMQHHARANELVTPGDEKGWTAARLKVARGRESILTAGGHIELPGRLEAATTSFVSGLGQVGFPKGGRMISRFHDEPENFGGGDQHKIESYTWNNLRHDPVMAAGTHHFLGVKTHGKAWLDANPDAYEALANAKNHPAWHDFTSTMDVWSGRVGSGLPYHATEMMGEGATNPEKLLTGRGMPNKPTGSGIGSAADAGYLIGEEAHRQAAASQRIQVKGVGRMSMPPHVAQSLSWYGVQGERDADAIRSNEKTMAPTSMDDSRSLNSLKMPRLH